MKKILSILIILVSKCLFSQNKASDTVLQNALIAHAEAIISEKTDSSMILFVEVAAISDKNLKLKLPKALYNTFLKKHSIALNDIGYIYSIKGDRVKAIDYFLKSLKIDEGFGDELGIASSYNNVSNIYFADGNVSKALYYVNKGLCLYLKNHNDEGIANSYLSLGYYYDFLGDLKLSIDFYHKSIMLYEKNNRQKDVAKVLNNLASIYGSLGDQEKALEYYEKSLKIKQKVNDQKGIALALNNIGKIYTSKKEYDRALEYFDKSYVICNEIGNRPVLALILNNIGRMYMLKNESDSAIKYFTEGLIIRQQINDKDGEASSLQSLSIIYLKDQNLEKAKQCGEKSFEIAKELGFPEAMASSSLILKDIFLKLKLYNKAYEYQDIYYKMRDSLSNTETKKAGIKSQFKYEYEKQAAADSVKIAEEKKIVAVQLKQEKTQRYALYGGLVLVIVFAGFMFNRFKVTQNQKQIIELKERETSHQKHIIEEKHQEITDSINYAERIQRSFLATKEQLDEQLKDYFVLFQPKDVVSGDFYWAHTLHNGNFALVTADSTGHGVPGAIMSLLNTSSLEKAVELGINEPAEILNHTRLTIIQRLKKDGSSEGGKDGMDCSLISFNKEKTKLVYAAANNPIWIIRNAELIELSPDKIPVGKHDRDSSSFTQHEVELQKGDMVYTLTDGFPDQFGGPKGKKFMYKKLKELLISVADKRTNEQHAVLKDILKDWMGNTEQVDDITIIGIRV